MIREEVYVETSEHYQNQRRKVWAALVTGEWKTLAELEFETGEPQASIQARFRDFRKKKYGEHRMESRVRSGHTWEYRYVPKSKLQG